MQAVIKVAAKEGESFVHEQAVSQHRFTLYHGFVDTVVIRKKEVETLKRDHES